MIIPDRETAEDLTWHIDGLLENSLALPPRLAITLRAYRDELIRQCAREAWARNRHCSRYARLADTIEQHITDGTWKPGQRMPSGTCLGKTYREKAHTVRRALFVLTVRGRLARDGQTYYVLPGHIADMRPRMPERSG